MLNVNASNSYVNKQIQITRTKSREDKEEKTQFFNTQQQSTNDFKKCSYSLGEVRLTATSR